MWPELRRKKWGGELEGPDNAGKVQGLDFKSCAKPLTISPGAELFFCEENPQGRGCPGGICHCALGFEAGPS